MESVKKDGKQKKGGRPVKAIKRQSATGVRFTRSEYFIVKNKAQKAGYKTTQYIRAMALEGRLVPRLDGQEKELLLALAGMANNLNQLAKKAHQEGLLKALLYFEKYREQIDALLKRLRP